MPWNEVSAVDLHREFVSLAGSEEANIHLIRQSFGISAKTAYKWLGALSKEVPRPWQIVRAAPIRAPIEPNPTWNRPCWHETSIPLGMCGNWRVG